MCENPKAIENPAMAMRFVSPDLFALADLYAANIDGAHAGASADRLRTGLDSLRHKRQLAETAAMRRVEIGKHMQHARGVAALAL